MNNMNISPNEKRKPSGEEELRSNKKQKTNQYDDAVALLHGLGKNTKIISPYSNEQSPKTPPPLHYSTPITIPPPSFNISHNLENTYQPYNISPGHYALMNDLSGGMCLPGLGYVSTPYPSIPFPYTYTYPPVLPFTQVVQPVQPVTESTKQMIHPGQISIGPDSLLYQTLTENSLRKDNSKRNKFFYKEVKDYLEDESNTKLGFVNDVFFLFDPKLHVGPTNRDGTFEKRVRLHFIEWVEVKNNLFNLWLCWGTLLDVNNLPIFRASNDIYRIPGNQSTLFKANKCIQGWSVADEHQKKKLRDQAEIIKQELLSKWKSGLISDAQEIVKSLKLETNQTTQTASPKCLLEPTHLAYDFWTKCNFSEKSVQLNKDDILKIIDILIITDCKDHVYDIFECLEVIDTNGILTTDSVELAIKRFGPIDVIFNNMLSLIRTKCFNGNMSAEEAKEFLEGQDSGSYILRYSQNSPETFCIAYKDEQDLIRQYNKIKFDYPSGLDVDGEKFDSWKSFISNSKYSLKYPKVHPKLKKLVELSNIL